MKKTYIAPVCETIVINGEDIITASFNGEEVNLVDGGFGDQINLGEIDFN